jgi:putative membrane protein
VVGILGFSRVLKYCLAHYYNATVCVLTGLMIGAMRKVWPWKVVLESELIRGKEYVLREENILPAVNGQLAIALSLMGAGLVFVILLERLARRA